VVWRVHGELFDWLTFGVDVALLTTAPCCRSPSGPLLRRNITDAARRNVDAVAQLRHWSSWR
jgi:hypothetical protein